MILKIAYFLTKGAKWDSPVKPELASTLNEAKALGVVYPPQGFHSVLFWVDLFIAILNQQGRLPQGVFETELRNRTEILYDIWYVAMRYREDEPQLEEVGAFTRALSWLMDKRLDLWSIR